MPVLMLAPPPTTVPPMLEMVRPTVVRQTVVRPTVERPTVARLVRTAMPTQETPRRERTSRTARTHRTRPDSSSSSKKTVNKPKMTSRRRTNSRPNSRPNNRHRLDKVRMPGRLLRPLLKHKHRHRQ